MSNPASRATRSARLVTRLALITVVMFGFGYALVPLYDLFCDVTGIGGRTGVISEQAALQGAAGAADEQRWVTVEFTGNTAAGLPWDFQPLRRNMRVRPGELSDVLYYAHNRSSRAITAQAIPSVAPGEAAKYFNKTECFCFENQTLEAGGGKEMPVRFVVDRALPDSVHTITLSYAFYNINVAGGAAPEHRHDHDADDHRETHQ